MAYGTGLDAQIGIAKETTYGTFKTPTEYYEFNSHSLAPVVSKLYSRPLGSGRTQKTSRRRTFITGGGGTFEIDAVDRGIGLLLELMFGKVVVAKVGETAEYTWTFTKHASGKKGLSATVQAGVPTTEGTIVPFNFLGGKVVSWAMAAALDDILKITPTWDFKSAETSSALGTPSYASDAQPFTFLDGTLTIGGDGIGTVRNVSLAWAEAMNVARRSFGNTKNEPLANGELAITGQFDSEFTNSDAFDAWVAGDELTNMVLTFTGGDLIEEGGNPYKLEITIPSLEYTGSAPSVSGPDVVPQSLPFKALDNGTDEIITAVLHTSDTDGA